MANEKGDSRRSSMEVKRDFLTHFIQRVTFSMV